MKNILLIEDNEDHIELIERALNQDSKKIKILRAQTLHEALQVIKTHSIDLILSDYYLPDSKGESHIKLLSQKVPEVPIVIITGQGDEKIAAKSIKAGAVDYIVKTREALLVLPKILNRAMTKHHGQVFRSKQMKKKTVSSQKDAIQKALKEVESIQGKLNKSLSVDHLFQQLDSLKKFLQNLFS